MGFLTVVPLLLQVAEFVDERPEEVKQMEAFRSSAKWKLLGGECQQQHNCTSHFQDGFLLLPCLRGMPGLFYVSDDEKHDGTKMSGL